MLTFLRMTVSTATHAFRDKCYDTFGATKVRQTFTLWPCPCGQWLNLVGKDDDDWMVMFSEIICSLACYVQT
jgi:hypothetical protein